ncbi:dTMP kinase [Patescibacteria group bacterium]|nr:dTMP kinase [Patescibacteria group bacterium]MBU1673508.1 dTMP kinase [Patescibacteria group bacterium]MBU1963746.1 dTMP kinase [Patescibacteria group bacterium]
MKGKFITLEGGEGSGKSVAAKHLKKLLEKKGKKVMLTHEPGGTVVADKIRKIILHENREKLADRAELFLFLASRAQHMEQKIIPALKRGENVICDRFNGSTFAYQAFARKVADLAFMKKMDKFVRWDVDPDLILYLDADPKIGLARRKGDKSKKLTRIDKEKLDFHKKVRSGFNKLLKSEKNWVKINSNKSINEVYNQIDEVINRKVR